MTKVTGSGNAALKSSHAARARRELAQLKASVITIAEIEATATEFAAFFEAQAELLIKQLCDCRAIVAAVAEDEMLKIVSDHRYGMHADGTEQMNRRRR
jgi:hypothetical protein